MKIVTLELTNVQPLLLTSLQGDPNSSVSFPYIPGSVLRGALIGRYRERRGSDLDLEDRDVQRLFFSGATRFLHAYPLIDAVRALPMPRSLVRNAKAQDATEKRVTVYDRSASAITYPDDFKPKALGGFLARDRGSFLHYGVEMLINIHNQRDRPRGRGAEGQGALFRYEAIAPRQHFATAILCEQDDDAATFASIIPTRMWLGGSRSAGYGETTIDGVKIVDSWQEWQHPSSYTAEDDYEEDGEGEESEEAREAYTRPGRTLVTVTLASDMFVRDEHGVFSAQPPVTQLIDALGVPLALDFARSIIGASPHGGFNRTWGLPTPQIQALAAGSVLVFSDLQSFPSPGALAQLEAQGIGERRAEGFGRVVCGMLPDQATHTLERWEPEAADNSAGELDDESRALAQLMARRIRDQRLETRLLNQVQRNRIEGNISNTQLSRLRIIARRALGGSTTGDIETFLANLPANARDQFAKARVVSGESSKALDAWLRERMGNPGAGAAEPARVAHEEAQIDPKTAVDFTLRLIMAMARLKVKGGDDD